MARPPTRRSVRRRRVLAGLTAFGGAATVGSTTARRNARGGGSVASDGDDATATATLEPAGTLDLRGAAEAVVDDDGTTVYCSLVDGFGVVDASDPANPTVAYEERELTHDGSDPMQSIMDVKVSGDRLLVSGPNGFGEGLSGFFLYDVSDPTNPERVAVHETAFGPHNSFIDGDTVYLTGSGERGQPVVVYDVSDDDPEEVARWKAADADDAWADAGRNYRQAHDIYVQEDTLYVAYWDAGTWLVDVSDPSDPHATRFLGGHDPEYLAEVEGFSPEFRELPGNSHYVQPNAHGSRVFVGKEAWDAEETERDGGPGGIELWDVSTSHPTLGAVLAPPEPGTSEDGDGWTSHNFGVDGDRLYTSWYSGGVRVYDVGDEDEPRLLGEWRESSETSFWTAKPLESGFVATSYANPENSREERQRGEGARVYVFPEPDEADAEPAPTMERREFPRPEADDDRTTASGTARPTTTTEPGTTPTTGETSSPTTTTDAGTTANGGTTVVDDPSPVPGFGALTALAGGGLGLWRLLAGSDVAADDEDA